MLAPIGLLGISRLSVDFQVRVIDIAWQDTIRPLCLIVYILTILGLVLNYVFTQKFKPEKHGVQEAEQRQEVERYRKPTRILHWSLAALFVVLFGSGLVIFCFPGAAISGSSWLHSMHRVAGIVFIILPLLYLLINPKAAWRGIKLAFVWGADDLEWVKAAPEYYYLHDERAMPPQGFLNTHQKAWWLAAIVLGPVLAITGVLLWAFEASAATQFYQLMLFCHSVSFIIIGNMFLMHIYLAVIHPVTRPWKTGPWGAMTRGKVPMEYARSHHGKWIEGLQKAGEDR